MQGPAEDAAEVLPEDERRQAEDGAHDRPLQHLHALVFAQEATQLVCQLFVSSRHGRSDGQSAAVGVEPRSSGRAGKADETEGEGLQPPTPCRIGCAPSAPSHEPWSPPRESVGGPNGKTRNPCAARRRTLRRAIEVRRGAGPQPRDANPSPLHPQPPDWTSSPESCPAGTPPRPCEKAHRCQRDEKAR